MSTLKVGTIQDHANSNTAMTIDSSGRILTPARPAFRAEKRASNQTVTSGVTALVTFEHEAFDIGSDYDTSTSRFTAPIAGIYHFNAIVRAVANNGTMDYVAMKLYKNGSLYADMFQMQTASNQMGNSHIGGSATVQLVATDYVSIHASISGTSPVVHSHATGQRTWFSGHLIG
tara:strand:+ start:151 stop:672 length:522 start_codon:yes stop_codon:yes gene_type:complete